MPSSDNHALHGKCKLSNFANLSLVILYKLSLPSNDQHPLCKLAVCPLRIHMWNRKRTQSMYTQKYAIIHIYFTMSCKISNMTQLKTYVCARVRARTHTHTHTHTHVRGCIGDIPQGRGLYHSFCASLRAIYTYVCLVQIMLIWKPRPTWNEHLENMASTVMRYMQVMLLIQNRCRKGPYSSGTFNLLHCVIMNLPLHTVQATVTSTPVLIPISANWQICYMFS